MKCLDSKGKSLTARLNKRVVIEQPSATTDSYGQPLNTWTEVTSVWAAIEPLQGNEYHAASWDNVDVKTRIRIRYRRGIDRTMRITYKDTTFEILDVINPKFANVELQLMCKERQ